MESLDIIIGHMACIGKHKWIFGEDCTGAVNHQSLLEVRNQCKFTISASVQHHYIFRVITQSVIFKEEAPTTTNLGVVDPPLTQHSTSYNILPS